MLLTYNASQYQYPDYLWVANRFLIKKPASAVALDINRYHSYLTRLKIAGLQCLPTHDDFFLFFGSADSKANLTNYNKYIRQHLDPETRTIGKAPRGGAATWPDRRS